MMHTPHRILVVDDQEAVCYSLKRFLAAQGYLVRTTKDPREGLRWIEEFSPDLVISDVRMPEMDGIAFLGAARELDNNLQVVLITAYSTTEQAIEAMKLGAFDYLIKPFDNALLLTKVEEAIRARVMMESVVTFDDWEEIPSSERIVGRSPQMLAVCKQVGKIAPSDATVLVQGESGTGKELIARAIYHHSRRVRKPFLAINCAALPEQLLESELFGYEAGAFTGADFRRLGKFEQLDGGTLFLDEIGEMPLSIQAKFLRVLQTGEFQRLGGSKTMTADVRIIAATNQDLAEKVAQGAFREDLFYRVNVVSLHLPPLRERPGDVKELVTHFIRKYNQFLGKRIRGIQAEALEVLEGASWPGNVRQLENVIQKAMVLCPFDHLTVGCIGKLDPVAASQRCYTDIDEAFAKIADWALEHPSPSIYADLLSRFEKVLIEKALDATGANQVKAAQLLGIARNTLRKKLNPSS